MRVAILWTGLSGYINTCIQKLAQHEGVEVFVSCEVPVEDAPFDEKQFAWIQNCVRWHIAPDYEDLRTRLEAFAPDVLIFAGWHIRPYRRIARGFADRCLRIMTMDNPWRATTKQIAGVLFSRYYVRPLADAVWLPGERQAIFAKKMGFEQRSILRGMYSCDRASMAAVHLERLARNAPVPRRFIFVGRFVAEKGLHTLVKAYDMYRKSQPDPWPLMCCGAGPLKSLLENKPGIHVAGFVQPAELPLRLGSAGCLVLPSAFEPWALVIHEAASAGLLILASENVGAAVHMVQPNYNGYIAGTNDASGLARLMRAVSAMSDARLDQMSRGSHCLSQQFSPEIWADTLLHCYSEWGNRLAHS